MQGICAQYLVSNDESAKNSAHSLLYPSYLFNIDDIDINCEKKTYTSADNCRSGGSNLLLS